MKKKRALIIGFPWEFQIDFIDAFNIEPVYWYCNKTPDTPMISERCTWHDAVAAINGGMPPELEGVSIPYLPQTFFDENHKFCLDNIRSYLDRQDFYGRDLDLNKARRLLYRDTSFWSFIFQTYNIEIVLVDHVPHTPMDLIAFRLAKLRNITACFFFQTWEAVSSPHRFFICDDTDDIFRERSMHGQKSQSVLPVTVKNVKPPSLVLFDQNWKHRCLGGLKSLVRGDFPFKDKLRNLKHRAQIKYHSQSVPQGKFVYFPLTVQPEYCGSPMGGHFEDQIHALESLSRKLPDDWSIVVKEHPGQYTVTIPRRNNFLSDLVNVPKVRLVDTSTDSFRLIETAEIVALLGGTAGWEALLRGKPVIVFGQIWYLRCNGAYHWNEVSQSMGFIDSAAGPKREDVENTISWLYDSTHSGIIHQQMLAAGLHALGFTIKDNTASVSEAFNSYLSESIKCSYS